MARPLRIAVPALAGLLLAASGCGKEPSYKMRWQVLSRPGQPLEPLPETPDEPGVQNPNECTRVGVVSVEVTAWDELGFVADQRTYPCYPREFFPPQGLARGAVLADGSYELVVRGVRRNGVGWTGLGADLDRNDDGIDEFDPTPRCDDDGQCEPGFVSCDCRFIDVSEGRTLILDDLELDAPPECEDGIDNDIDGLVDGADPGCTLGDSEFDDITSVQFRVEVSLLGQNPNATCTGVGVTEFAFSLDGEELTRTPCRLAPLFFTAELEAGPHQLSVVASGSDGLERTAVLSEEFEIAERGGLVETSFDFADADFIEPLRRSALVPLSFVSSPGSTPHRCTSINGDLIIDAVRINVLDARGQELATPIRDESGVPLDGRSIPCPPGNIRTETLAWGGFVADIQAIALVPDPDDPMAPPQEVVCYSTTATNGPEPLAPGEPSFDLLRPEGPVPPACTECDANDPARPCLAGTCVDGVCVE